MGFSSIILLPYKATLTCDRYKDTEENCTLVEKRYNGSKTFSFSDTELIEAAVEEEQDEGVVTYCLYLELENSSKSFASSCNDSGKQAYQNAEKINNFINDDSVKHIIVVQDERLLAYFLGTVLILVGTGLCFIPLIIKKIRK